MKQTENYQLPTWEESDRILMKDFNGMTEKIDGALAAKCEVVFGTYTGDGEETRTIQLGFTPQAVYLNPNSGNTSYSNNVNISYYGGLALKDHPLMVQNVNMVEIVEGGFTVAQKGITNNLAVLANVRDTVYHYVAVK